MDAARRFSVLTTGIIGPGFDETQVALDFVDLIQTTPEKAIAFIHSEQRLVSGVEQSRALAYQKKLAEIGIGTKVIDLDESETANDATVTDEEPTDVEFGALLLEPVSTGTQDAGIKASIEEELNFGASIDGGGPIGELIHITQAETTPNSEIFEKAATANTADNSTDESFNGSEAPKPSQYSEESILDNIRDAGASLNTRDEVMPGSSLRNRSFSFTSLAMISALVIASVPAFIYVTRTPEVALISVRNSPTYFVENIASSEVNELIEVSGMQDQFERFASIVDQRHRTKVSELISSGTTIASKQVEDLIRLVPVTYNTNALNNSIANWVHKNTFDEDVPMLIEIFNQPSVQDYLTLRAEKNPTLDPKGFASFVSLITENPLEGPRQRAIIDVVDGLLLDKAVYEIEGDLRRAIITTIGELPADSDRPEAKDSIRKQVREMRDQLVYKRPELRRLEEQIVAWQFEGVDVKQIKALSDALDNSSVRELYRQMIKGYEEFLTYSTLWLHRQL